MPTHLFAALLLTPARAVRHWLFHLGGVGLIPLGLLDNSPIPLPGAMDVATIVLSARQQQLWIYYGLMATAGSLIGGFLTYRIARKGGKEALEGKFPRRRVAKVLKIFERWGFFAISIPALLPPPVPMVPFLFAAGALQYPARKFLAALAAGRFCRYMILSYLGARYGRQVLSFFLERGQPVVFITVTLLVVVAAAVYYYYRRVRKRRKQT
jgi:membrane protein DedA with SNARE-associated domain